jgi:Uncharacterized conserved protein (DUF2190)
MSKQQLATRVVTVVAAGALTAKRGVLNSGLIAGANAIILGVADHDAAIGEATRVVVGESAIVEVGAACDGVENRLMTDATGRFIPWTATNNIAARLVLGQTATAAGQFVEAYLVKV